MQRHSRICYARDGAGNYSNPYPDFVAGTTIESAQVDANNSDIAAALTASLAKDGQTVPTANLPMGGFKHTGVGAASALTHYARADQVIGSVLDYAADTGTATAYAIAPSPGISAYVVGQRFAFKATNANSGADPTLAVNSLTAGIIYWPDGSSLAASDIAANAQIVVQVASVTTGTPTFHLQTGGNVSATQSPGNNTRKNATTAFVTAAVTAATAKVYVQTFTATGTYTPHAGMVNCIIECVGGGGGGGGTATAGGNQGSGGGGGGAGGYSRKLATAADVGASQAVTIGAAGTAGASGNNAGGNGGDTSVGTLCVGKGGTGGAGSDGANLSVTATGGAGGVSGTGTVTAVGEPGGTANVYNLCGGLSGAGGSSPFGAGGRAAVSATTTAGVAGSGYGSGGSGGASYSGGGAAAGGAGTAGYVVVTEFCSQ